MDSVEIENVLNDELIKGWVKWYGVDFYYYYWEDIK